MRAAALVLLAVAAVVPRPGRGVLGVLAAGFLLRAVWTSGFDQGGSRAWLAVAGVVIITAAAIVLPDAAGEPAGWRWVVLAGAVGVAYSCVPETDQFREIAVVVLGGAAVEVLAVRTVPPAAYLGAWGALAWGTLYGATGRPSAIVGGLVALLAPVAAAWASSERGLTSARGSAVTVPSSSTGRGWLGLAVGSVWVVAGLVVARTGGIAAELRPALVAAAVGVVPALGVSAMLWRHWPTAPVAE